MRLLGFPRSYLRFLGRRAFNCTEMEHPQEPLEGTAVQSALRSCSRRAGLKVQPRVIAGD